MKQWPSLPVMQCDEDCGECCGPVFCSPGEFGRIKQFVERNGVTPIAQGFLTCPFYQGGQCAIYEARPFTCRMFGHCSKMVCPRGYNANVTREREDELIREYMRRGGRMDQGKLLHEFAYSLDEIKQLAKIAQKKFLVSQ